MYVAQGPEQLAPLSEIRALTGLELITAILEGHLPGPPIAATMGYSMHAAERGRVTFRGTTRFAHCNPMGQVHGGWYGTLLDSAMACAIQTMVPPATGVPTLEYKINILRAVPVDTEIDCIGEVDHVGRSTGVAHGRILGVGDGRLYATGSTTCMVMAI